MADTPFSIANMPVNEIYLRITEQGISDMDARALIGEWILGGTRRGGRTFNYATSFPATEPGCVSNFNRTFQHQDWIDGESVVQAEQTTGEDGFNLRFHCIEQDLDRIRDDLRRAFSCMAAMRSSLRQMLEEIKLEINRLNQDVYNCCGKNNVTVFEPPNIDLGTVNPNVVPGPTFYGRTTFFGREVNVWQTNQGVVILPDVDPAANDVLLEPRLTRTASLARFMQEEVRGTFQGRPVTKEEMLRTFGTKTLKSGHTVAEALAILPDKVSYQTVDAMLDDVVEREAAAIRSRSGASGQIASSFNFGGAAGTTLNKVSVGEFQALPVGTRTALMAAGIDTLEKFANAKTEDLLNAARKADSAISLGDIAGFKTLARTLLKTQ